MQDKNYFVFLDVDETITNFKTMMDYLKFFYVYNSKNKKIGAMKYYFYALKIKLMDGLGVKRERLNRKYYENFKGVNKDDFNYLCKLWFKFKKSKSENFYNQKVLEEIRHHQSKGAKIILVSGSFDYLISLIAAEVNANHFMSTSLAIENNFITGEIKSKQTIGAGKASAIKRYICNQSGNVLKNAFAYGDHISDLPMLSLVGHPVVVGKNKELNSYARENKWQII